MSGAKALLVCESCISYSKSDTARKPLIKTSAPFFLAYSIVKPSKASTSTFSICPTLSCISLTRSSTFKKAFFYEFLATAIITLSKIPALVIKTSRCPLVIGSKLPGYIAIFIFFPFRLTIILQKRKAFVNFCYNNRLLLQLIISVIF